VGVALLVFVDDFLLKLREGQQKLRLVEALGFVLFFLLAFTFACKCRTGQLPAVSRRH
jgi:hypothetical protein